MEPTLVYWTSPTGSVHLAGRLATIGPAKIQRFTYDSAWMTGAGVSLGEGLPLGTGPIMPPGGETEFGLFLDAGPDAWGRRVISRKLSRSPRSASEFLLAAADHSRQGALRFAREPGGELVSDGGPEAIEFLSELRAEVEAFQADRDAPGEITRLLRAGTRQGGFRPKAAVVDAEGRQWIAKFPSEMDTYDVETCEAAALYVAREAGLTVPRFRHLRVGPDKAILLVERFDRTEAGRLGYQSMRTAARIGAYETIDYLMMAAVAGFHEGESGVLRIVALAALNVCINNIDDHSRNVGFLQDREGRWSVAPAFDTVPYPREGEGTPIAEGEAQRSLEHILETDWGVKRPHVEHAVSRVAGAASRLYSVAVEHFGMDAEAAAAAERRRLSVATLPRAFRSGEG